MAKYKIAVLPGDGVGHRSRRSGHDRPQEAGRRRRIHLRRHRLGILAQGGQRPARPDDQAAQGDRRLPVRGHHLQAQGGRGGGARSRRSRARACPTSAPSSASVRSSTSTRTSGRARPIPAIPSTTGTTSTWSSSGRTPRACTPASSSSPCPQSVKDALIDPSQDEGLQGRPARTRSPSRPGS